MSLSDDLSDQCILILFNIVGVIGNLTLSDSGECWEYSLLMPDCTNRSLGSDENSLGSGRPKVICIYLMPDKYVFIVWGDNLLDAKYDEK